MFEHDQSQRPVNNSKQNQVKLTYIFIKKNYSVRWAGAGGWCWNDVKEKYCWLAGGWRLVLERCEKKTLLSWRLVELPNTVNRKRSRAVDFSLSNNLGRLSISDVSILVDHNIFRIFR